MADFISLSLGASANAGLILRPYNNGSSDPVIYFNIENSAGFTIQPLERVSVLIIPHSDPITPTEASGYLADHNVSSDVSRGMYIFRYRNERNSEQNLTNLCRIPIRTTEWENIEYDLYWLQELDGGTIFDSYTTGVYSYPHNIQPQEVDLNAELINDNTRVRYTIRFNEVNNAGSADYAAHDPYRLNITYNYGDGEPTGYFSGSPISFTDVNDYTEFPSGYASGGIVFDLPYYDPRPTWNQVPAYYMFRLNYNCADPAVVGSYPLKIPINHQNWSEGLIRELDREVSLKVDPNKIRKVDEILIEDGVIDRRRFTIGIKDIAVKQNTYRKKGTYISNPYTSDNPIYTFSMRSDEFIPQYNGVESYDVVQYFVEFNSRPWLRISPINRDEELDSEGNIVPKMYVFDAEPGTSSTSIHFLNYQAPVTIFRVKITFDVSNVTDDLFIPPEIRDYECIIYDKVQLLEL